jgi:hypothetical protein
MKEILALIFFLAVSLFTIHKAIKKEISNFLTNSLLIFAVISGFVIANYNVLYTLRWGGLEVRTAKKEVGKVKESALNEIRYEVKEQKKILSDFISNANNTIEEIEKQKNSLQALIENAESLQNRVEQQKDNHQ